MKALVNGATVELRNGLCLECMPNEPIQLYGGTIEGQGTLTLTVIGRHDCAAVTATGQVLELQIVVFEPAILDFVRKQVRTVGQGDSCEYLPMDAKVRGIVRSLAAHADWFDGTLASMTTGDPARGLANHGA